MHYKLHRKAFTLIELLVVIAIIAILAAILFPVFATAREKARQSACQSNMKQIGLAFIQYAQDYDEFTAYCPYDGNRYQFNVAPYNYGISLGCQLYPYIKSTQVWRCPSDSLSTPQLVHSYLNQSGDQAGGCWGCYGGLDNVSYVYNAYYLIRWNPNATYLVNPIVEPTLSMAQMVSPGSVGIVFGGWGNMWMSDYIGGFEGRTEGYPNYAPNPNTGTTSPPTLVVGHNYGGEILYGDGHVKWMPSSQLATNLAKEISCAGGSTRSFGVCSTVYHE